MIILVSDGASSDLSGGNDADIAKRCLEQGIKVFAIHIANSDAPAEIVNITSLTGGEVFNPGDPDSLADVFRQLTTCKNLKSSRRLLNNWITLFLMLFLDYCY